MAEADASSWQEAWAPLRAAVGQDLGSAEVRWGADAIEPGTLRRWLEPLEFDAPVHRDREAARAAGHDDVIAPYTSLLTFALPATWTPGAPVFTDASRDAQPTYSPITTPELPGAPPTTGFFATDLEFEFVRPPRLGDRVGTRGLRLVACEPKQTKVGRGAFLTWETEVVDGDEQVIARQRVSAYAYNPFDGSER